MKKHDENVSVFMEKNISFQNLLKVLSLSSTETYLVIKSSQRLPWLIFVFNEN